MPTPTCSDLCILDFDAKFDGIADDTLAFEKALNELDALGGGKLILPVGQSVTSRPLKIKSGVTIEGKGFIATKINNRSSDVFHIEGDPASNNVPFCENAKFLDFEVNSLFDTEPPGGGHIFVLEGLAGYCIWRGLRLRCLNPDKQIVRRFATANTGGFYDCKFEDLYLVRTVKSTVPAFEVDGPGIQFSTNSIRDIRCEDTGDPADIPPSPAPFFRFTSRGAENNGNVMSRINFEKCVGGMVHFYSASNWLCEALVSYDLNVMGGTLRGDGILVDTTTGQQSMHMTFINCDRRDGVRQLSPEVFDLRIGAAQHVVMINCYDTIGQVNANYKVNANNRALTWLGVDKNNMGIPAADNQLVGTNSTIWAGRGKVWSAEVSTDDVVEPRSPPVI